MTDSEIQALVASAVASATADIPRPEKKRVPVFHAKTGEAAPTPDGCVWPIDAPDWLAAGYVLDRLEVEPEPEKARRKPGPKPGSKRKQAATPAGAAAAVKADG